MADAVVKRLVTRKIAEIKDERRRARPCVTSCSTISLPKRSSRRTRASSCSSTPSRSGFRADYRQLLGKVKEKLARERGFVI